VETFLEDPERIAGLSRADLAALLAKVKALEGALLAKLLTGDTAPSGSDSLDADELAAALGQSRRWVFRHAKELPFIIRTGAKSVVGSRAGLNRWLKARRA
jgi:hypothetical protein